MERKRSKGVTFWGSLILCIGLVYGLINSARNIWRIDYVLLPILYVTIGIGILCLKKWARITFLILAILTVTVGILGLPAYLQSIADLAETGKGWVVAALGMFIFRFIFAIGGLIFFLQRPVKEQFKKGGV